MQDDLDNESPRTNIIVTVRNRVEECFVKADIFYGEKVPRCQIKFDLTGKSAGTANFAKKELRFNRKLLIDNEQDFMQDTIPHEVAHIVQRWKYGYAVASHGNEWKKIMVEVFRIPPKRCHKLDVSKVLRKTREYRYTCNCVGKNWMISLIKHKKWQKNTAICNRCFSPFVWAGKGSLAKPQFLKETSLD